jgi:hypothetical protein
MQAGSGPAISGAEAHRCHGGNSTPSEHYRRFPPFGKEASNLKNVLAMLPPFYDAEHTRYPLNFATVNVD